MDFSAIKALIQQNIRTNNNEDITGNVLQQVLLGMIVTLGDDAINDLATDLDAEKVKIQNIRQTLQNILNAGYLYGGTAVPETSPGTPLVSTFFIATQAGTYNYFIDQNDSPITLSYDALYILTYEALENHYWECQKVCDMGDGVYDISANHNGATYADLAAALGTNGANVPEGIRKGGMSVKFVQSSENKYVQYRLMTTTWSAIPYSWERYNDVTTSNRQGSDLDFSDEQGNTLVIFKNGHVKTKNFDSSKDATTEERGLMSANDKVKLNTIKYKIDIVEPKLEAVETKLETIEEGAEVNDVITSNRQGYDLGFSDEQGNTLVMFKNGHIKTKNFDSSKNATTEERGLMSVEDKTKLDSVEEGADVSGLETEDTEHVDLDFSDEQGNVLVIFKGGGIKTKNFDSSKNATTEERGLMSEIDKAKLNGIEEGAQVNDVETGDSSADLDFSDEQNNVIVAFSRGHIKTKLFNSRYYQMQELHQSNQK